MTKVELTRSYRSQSLFPLNQQNLIKLGAVFSLAVRFLQYIVLKLFRPITQPSRIIINTAHCLPVEAVNGGICYRS